MSGVQGRSFSGGPITPSDVRDQGRDEYGRPKWIIAGKATDGLGIEILAVIDRDERGKLIVFITAYWRE